MKGEKEDFDFQLRGNSSGKKMRELKKKNREREWDWKMIYEAIEGIELGFVVDKSRGFKLNLRVLCSFFYVGISSSLLAFRLWRDEGRCFTTFWRLTSNTLIKSIKIESNDHHRWKKHRNWSMSNASLRFSAAFTFVVKLCVWLDVLFYTESKSNCRQLQSNNIKLAHLACVAQ